MSKPRVAIMTPSLKESAGGVERFATILASAIEDIADVRLVVGSSSVPRYVSRMGCQFAWRARSWAESVNEFNPQLTISNGVLGAGVNGRRLHVYHGTMPEAMRRTKRLTRRDRVRGGVAGGLAELSAGRTAAACISVSDSVRLEVNRFYGIESSVIENGVDLDIFRPRSKASARERLGLDQSARIALFVGRIEARKNADLAISAARMAGFSAVVAADAGPPEGTYLGVLPPSELSIAYAAADCLLVPSSYEACSLAILEGLAVGTPVITTEVGWMSTLLQRVPTYRRLVCKQDERSIERILRDLQNPALQQAVQTAHRSVVDNNGWDRTGRAWKALVASLLAS